MSDERRAGHSRLVYDKATRTIVKQTPPVSDLIQRLRKSAGEDEEHDWPSFEVENEAADELERLQRELAEARRCGREYIERTDPMLMCSEELTCGQCRGCLMARAERAESDLATVARNIASSPGKVVEESKVVGAALLRLDAAESDREQLRAALAELVRLKDLHDKHATGWHAFETYVEYQVAGEEYKRAKPLAWERARALAAHKEEKPTMNERILADAAASRQQFYETHAQVLSEIDAERKEEKTLRDKYGLCAGCLGVGTVDGYTCSDCLGTGAAMKEPKA